MPYVFLTNAGPNRYSIGREKVLKLPPESLAWSTETEHDATLELLLKKMLEPHYSHGSYEVDHPHLAHYLHEAQELLARHIEAQECSEAYSRLEPSTTMIAPTDEAKTLFDQLDSVKKKLALLECEKEYLENRIKALIGNAAGIQGVATWKATTINRLDSDAIKSQYPEIYASHLKTTKTRRFVLVK
ncbi:MAG: hypothetical protein JSR37_05190 [Verrucomicrobia bacterium]|nr:hypothetical protein [Verrucomicrobiota bacterium]MBS0636920.1 hypothetical protein [Verrucomicrobiota bacterium]